MVSGDLGGRDNDIIIVGAADGEGAFGVEGVGEGAILSVGNELRGDGGHGLGGHGANRGRRGLLQEGDERRIKLEGVAAEADLVAGLEGGGVFDLDAVDEGAVCAVEVCDLEAVAVGGDAGVVAGDLGSRDNNGVMFVITYCNASFFSFDIHKRWLHTASNPPNRFVILKHRRRGRALARRCAVWLRCWDRLFLKRCGQSQRFGHRRRL